MQDHDWEPLTAGFSAIPIRREGYWRVASSSVRGSSHERSGQPCQDAHRWSHLPNRVLVAAVADGAGSASLGEVGAAISVETAIDSLTGSPPASLARPDADAFAVSGVTEGDLWQAALLEALGSARAAVEAEATARGVRSRELASTLILVVAAPGQISVAQIGDGGVIAQDVNGELVALTTPPEGEYVNETTFIVSPGALESAQTAVWRGATARVAAFSDGLQRLCFRMPGCVPHAPFFQPLFEFVAAAEIEADAAAQLESFLSSERVRSRSDDDLTLLLAALVPPSS